MSHIEKPAISFSKDTLALAQTLIQCHHERSLAEAQKRNSKPQFGATKSDITTSTMAETTLQDARRKFDSASAALLNSARRDNASLIPVRNENQQDHARWSLQSQNANDAIIAALNPILQDMARENGIELP